MTYHCGSVNQDFAREIFGHLGYPHIVPTFLNEAADIKKEALEPLLARLRETADIRRGYGEEDIASLRAAIDGTHTSRGIPP